LPLLPLSRFHSSHDAHGIQIHRIQLQLPRQSPPLSCACVHALGLSLTRASHAKLLKQQINME